MESALTVLPTPKAAVGPRRSILPFSTVPTSRSSRCFLSFGRRCHSPRGLAGTSLWSFPSAAAPLRSRFASVMPRAGGGGGGNDVDGDADDGGGDGGSGGPETEAKSVAVDSEDDPALGEDVIVLHVGGMSCGGCAASVKRILESLTSVSAATVNLEKEMAFIWVIPEAKVRQDWQKMLGDTLAKHLTACGFPSNLQGLDGGGVAA